MIGYYIKLDDADHDRYSLIQVMERLTKRLYLVQQLNPSTAEPINFGMWVLDLKDIAELDENSDPRGRIFETKAALRQYLEMGEEEPTEPVPVRITH